jgi:hypothetical protein
MTPTRPTWATGDGRPYLDLQNAARRAGRDTTEYLALYALEGFLARLAASRHAMPTGPWAVHGGARRRGGW